MRTGNEQFAVSWGELLWDLFPSGPCLGGAPSNVAVHLATLGVPTALVSRVGADELGLSGIAELKGRGVHTAGVQIDDESPTGRVGITVTAGEPSYTLHEGAWRHIRCDQQAEALLRRTPIFCYGTLSQETAEGLESWRQALAALPNQALRFCDPNLRGGRIQSSLVLEHLQAATIVKINEEEAAVLERTYGCDDAPSWLLEEHGVELVAKTLGTRGAHLHRAGEDAYHCGYPASEGGDNVGAGDAFGAVLVAGALAQTPLDILVESANAYGSFVASHRGATPIPPSDLLTRLRRALSPQQR